MAERAPCGAAGARALLDKLSGLSGVQPMPLKRVLGVSRYVVLIAIVASLIGAAALMVYETLVIGTAVIETISTDHVSPKIAKVLAVGFIEAIDIFLIAIFGLISALGLYVLFIDDSLPLPRWLKIEDLDDLKAHLVSSVIAVLSVLFMREAVAWDGQRDLLGFGVALALVIAALTLYLAVKGKR
jgi:uncharacterized membrane protein YqhA